MSQELLRQAQDVLMAYSNQPPNLMKYGRGARIFDRDGKSYTDYCLSGGALIVGHTHRNVTLAIKRSVNLGISFDSITKAEIDLAGHVVKSVPSIEKIVFEETGFQALITAVNAAQQVTNREKVVVIGYSSRSKFPGSVFGKIKILNCEFNDIDALSEFVDQNKNKIACVVMAPIKMAGGISLPENGYLKKIRVITKDAGIILIFDETVTGFRASRGCAQGDFGIQPDLTCLGGIIGGGFPLGAVGGKNEIMEGFSGQKVNEDGLYSSANRVILRAGLAQMKLLSNDFYKVLNARSENFVNQMNAFFQEQKTEAHISAYKSMFSIVLRQAGFKDSTIAPDQAACQKYGHLRQYLLDNNIYGPPEGRGVYFISGMHSQKELNYLIEVLKKFFLTTKKC